MTDRDSKDTNQGNGNNTFLSRVFGMQSDDMAASIRTGDMSRFPLATNDNESSVLNGSRISSELADEDPRIPQSDQDTTSAEDDDYDNSEGDSTENVDLDADNLVNNDRINKNKNGSTNYNEYDSIRKVGQESSDEESQYNEDYGENDPEESLFPNKYKVIASKKNLEGNDDIPSLLFQRILQTKSQNPATIDSKRLFTSSNLKHSQYNNRRKYFNKSVKPDNHNNRRNSFFWNPQEEDTQNTAFQLRRPNLLKNISILNGTPLNKINTLSPKERALWKWANVENLDVFLQDVYKYYLGNGFQCIVLQKFLNLGTLIFVVFISTYLGYCIDYPKLSSSEKLADVIVGQCYTTSITGFAKGLLWIFYIFVVLKIVQFYFDIQNLNDMHKFYSFLLNISDKELQTIPWQNVIQQIMFLKDQNALTANVVEVKAKNKIDPLVVANRIMRKENYLIALYNSNILDLSLPIPLFRTSILTKTLEWNINLCVIGFAFNEAGFIKQSFLKKSQAIYLNEELKKRFLLAGFLNIILSPFLVTYFILLYFFRYFNEYKTSPGALGARQYTPMAEWNFREYNELYHIFQKRLGISTGLADKYINQFPKEAVDLLLKFISFVSGSFVAILASLTIYDSEIFLNFEITKDKSCLFYITVLGAIWTVCRNSISNEYKIFDPEETIHELATFTHYLPNEWEGRYHTEEVRQEFCKLYNLRVIILLRELASLLLTPFILWFSLPKCSNKILEFLCESSVYVDGLGYVCKFAAFDINQDGLQPQKTKIRSQSMKSGVNIEINNNKSNIDEEAIETESDSEQELNEPMNKMMQSYMYFMEDYENSNNALGKNQLPNRRYSDYNPVDYSGLNTNYSWRKQFQPGQRPELFRIGRHALNPSPNILNDKKTQNKRESFSSLNNNLGESFINSDVLAHRNLAHSYLQKEEHKDKRGILNMVKEYYKTSDIGR